jgi:DNA gyrase subunit B
MNPVNRNLLLVTVDDSTETDRTFYIQMGDDMDPRKRFIQTYFKTVRNLDI